MDQNFELKMTVKTVWRNNCFHMNGELSENFYAGMGERGKITLPRLVSIHMDDYLKQMNATVGDKVQV